MAMTYPKVICEGESDRHPLLMERPVGTLNHGHVIDIPPHGDNASSSTPNNEIRSSHEQHNRPALSTSHSESALPLPSGTPSSRSSSFIRRTDNYGRRHRSPLNSGLWVSIELIIAVSQIVASIIVLSLSRNERPQTPLFVWVVGYACGCFSTLPLLYWRYLTRNRVPQQDSANPDSVQENIPVETSYTVLSTPQTSEEEEGHTTTSSWDRSTNLRNSRLGTFVDHFKMALDCFFAVWFIVGNVWIFGGHSSFSEAPNLYRLCIVFLTFSCIGYAMPFIFCATICCCLPCIISMLGYREDQYHNRGATSETIGSLPTHKFKAKGQERGKDDGDVESDDSCGGGIIFAGTEKEKVVSAEDAVCCICLAKYIDNDDLRELPCSHFFHVECVDKWLKINAMCPLCKHEVGEDNSRLSVEGSDTRQAEQRVQSGEAVGIGYGMV